VKNRCGGCAHALPVSEIDGFCRRFPPVPVAEPSGAVTSRFPSVHLANFWCGEFKKSPEGRPARRIPSRD
jgi:hypothetical protein